MSFAGTCHLHSALVLVDSYGNSYAFFRLFDFLGVSDNIRNTVISYCSEGSQLRNIGISAVTLSSFDFYQNFFIEPPPEIIRYILSYKITKFNRKN